MVKQMPNRTAFFAVCRNMEIAEFSEGNSVLNLISATFQPLICVNDHSGMTIFREGDPPDGWYFVLHGQVSILKNIAEVKPESAGDDNAPRPASTKLVAELDEGTSYVASCLASQRILSVVSALYYCAVFFRFGELAFLASTTGQRSQTRSATAEAGSAERREVHAALVAQRAAANLPPPPPLLPVVCARVQGAAFERHICGSDRLFAEARKLDMLRRMVPFAHWSEQDLLALSKATELRLAQPGDTLLRQGERFNQILVIFRGEITVGVAHSRPSRHHGDNCVYVPKQRSAKDKANDSSDVENDGGDGSSTAGGIVGRKRDPTVMTCTQVARVKGPGELFGLVELFDGAHTMLRTAKVGRLGGCTYASMPMCMRVSLRPGRSRYSRGGSCERRGCCV